MDELAVRAKELVRTVRHAAIATVNTDGSPHNSPVFTAFDDDITMIWASRPEAIHSKNIARTSQAYIVLFDAFEKGQGLFLQCKATEVTKADFDHAMSIFNRARAQHLGEHVPPEYFRPPNAEQRLYMAKPTRLWVNQSDKDAKGFVVADYRHELAIDHLL